MNRRLLILIAGSLAFWAATVVPAVYIWGETMIGLSAVAAALCVPPGVIALVWAERAPRNSAAQQIAMIFGGTGLRMALVLGVGMTLWWSVFREQTGYAFWAWVLVFYLFTLALEVALVLTGRSAAGNA